MARSRLYLIPLRCWVRVPVRRPFTATVHVTLLLLLQRSGTWNEISHVSPPAQSVYEQLVCTYVICTRGEKSGLRSRFVSYPLVLHDIFGMNCGMSHAHTNLQSLGRLATSLLQLFRFDVILPSMQISSCGCLCDLSHLLKLRTQDMP